ncbi:MAG TPA: hypothetical protein VMH34_04125 [Gammaproteobacteria bacterium]|nr:hypothetical protein [Gammaproteobacteria bacterium]
MNNKRNLGNVLWMLALALVLGACARMEASKRADALDDATKTYAQLLRWGQWSDAVKYIVLRKGQPRQVNLDTLKDIRVSSYEINDMVMASDQKEAAVTAVITFYHERSGVIHTLEDHQVWWYSDEGRHWLLDSELPDFIGALKKRQ